MSIKTMNMYTVICDGCGKDVMADTEYSGYGEIMHSLEVADNADWLDENGDGCTETSEHYCPDCHFYDDEDVFHVKKQKE